MNEGTAPEYPTNDDRESLELLRLDLIEATLKWAECANESAADITAIVRRISSADGDRIIYGEAV